ncbi:response regulator transcription factor [Devosia submarina]|uniref:response regulator transcription factor n=1 Tax=Devosia submarina TaxID=1173082 RepID=UPI0013004533|nr:response regulator transcription factor [Devosia submarina]
MHGLGKPAELRAGQGKPKIVFLATAEAGLDVLVDLSSQRMPNFAVELHDPFARFETDQMVDLVLMRPMVESDVTRYLVAGRRLYPNAAMGLLVGGRLLSGSVELLQSGLVRGLVPLNMDIGVLAAVLGILVAGGEYCPPDLAMRFPKPGVVQTGEREDGRNYAAHRLTPRETQIMGLLSKGLQNKIIAAQMGLSEHTVKAHVRNLFAKLRVSNRTQAVAKCRDWIGDSRYDAAGDPMRGNGAQLHLSPR